MSKTAKTPSQASQKRAAIQAAYRDEFYRKMRQKMAHADADDFFKGHGVGCLCDVCLR
jgi:hypothetical protein